MQKAPGDSWEMISCEPAAMQLEPLKFCQTCGLQIYDGSSSWCHPLSTNTFRGRDGWCIFGRLQHRSVAKKQKKQTMCEVCWWNSRGERLRRGWPLKWTQICGEAWIGKDGSDVGAWGQCTDSMRNEFSHYSAFLILCPLNQKWI